jgi:hypothetical protein
MQVDGKSIVSRRTMYPGGEAVTLDLEFRPIRMICNEEQGPATVVLVTAIPVAVQVFASFDPVALWYCNMIVTLERGILCLKQPQGHARSVLHDSAYLLAIGFLCVFMISP